MLRSAATRRVSKHRPPPSFETVRRETGKEYEVKVLYSEGVANHTDPEPCVRPVRSRAKRR
jgi:hypothetical protein